MPYLAPAALRPSKIADVQSVALFVSSDPGDVSFLITDGVAIFLTGENAGHFFDQKRADWDGVAIEGLRLEVDTTSRLDPEITAPLLCVVRRNQGVFIWGTSKSQGFYQRSRILVENDLPMGEAGREESFGRWRLVIGDGVDLREVYVHPNDQSNTNTD